MPTFAATQAGYTAMWAKAQIAPAHLAAAKALAAKIIANKARYQEIETDTGVPWFMVGVIHLRESDLDFTTYLGNGDKLSRPTVNVPKGRGPFASFVLGAIDALVFQGYTTIKVWIAAYVLYALEEFNGEGYEKFHNENSPYLWAWTTLQQLGKYNSDGSFDRNTMDTQPGCVAILKALCLADPTVNAFMNPAAAAPPQPKDTATVTTPAPTAITLALPSGELVKITQLLETVITYLPMVGGFFPPLAPIVPFVPVIESVLKALEQIESSTGSAADILSIIETNFHSIATAASTVKAKLPPPVPLTPVQAAQTAPN